MTRSIPAIASATVALVLTVGGCARAIDRDLVNAASGGDVHRIEVLLTKGADPNKLALDGWNALSAASREGHVEAVTVLLRSGAKIDAPEGGGNTPLFWAAFYGRTDVVRLLIADGADLNKKSNGGGTAWQSRRC